MHQSPSGGTAAALVALFAGGAIGFHLGYTRFPHWQIPVESAQVLAGVVVYPHETPFYVHHVNLWTLQPQVCAVFLRAGVSEIALSRIVSGVLGMLSLQALAMFTFAFSGRALHLRASVDEPRFGGPVTAIGAALLLFVSEVTYAGAVHPIFLMVLVDTGALDTIPYTPGSGRPNCVGPAACWKGFTKDTGSGTQPKTGSRSGEGMT